MTTLASFDFAADQISQTGDNESNMAFDQAAYGEELDTNKRVTTSKFKAHHNSIITSIETNEDSIFTCGQDGKIKIWSQDDNFSLKKTIQKHTRPVTSCAISPDARWLLSSSYDKTIQLYDLEKDTPLVFKGHDSAALTVALSDDSRVICSGGADNKIMMWNIKGDMKKVSEHHKGFVNHLQFNPAFPEILFSCSQDGTIKGFGLDGNTTFSPYADLTGHNAPVSHFNISPDGSLLASISATSLQLYDICMSEPCASIPLPLKQQAKYGKKTKTITARGSCVQFNPVSVWMSYAFGSKIQVNSLNSKQAENSSFSFNIYDHDNQSKGFITCMAWSKDGQKLYAGATNGMVYTYEFPQEFANEN